MKKLYFYSMMPLALVMVLLLFFTTTFAQTSQNNSQISTTVYSFNAAKNNRVLKRMQKEATAVQQNGGMTAIRISNSGVNKLADGRQKAYVDELENLSQQIESKISYLSYVYQTRRQYSENIDYFKSFFHNVFNS